MYNTLNLCCLNHEREIFMDLQLKKYKKNEIIYHIEDIPQAIGIVKEGSVVIEL